MNKLSPGVIAAIVLGVIAVVVVIYEATTMGKSLGGPVIGTKDDMPEAMKKAYGGAPPPKSSTP
jgi:hypothetical protein